MGGFPQSSQRIWNLAPGTSCSPISHSSMHCSIASSIAASPSASTARPCALRRRHHRRPPRGHRDLRDASPPPRNSQQQIRLQILLIQPASTTRYSPQSKNNPRNYRREFDRQRHTPVALRFARLPPGSFGFAEPCPGGISFLQPHEIKTNKNKTETLPALAITRALTGFNLMSRSGSV